jgi:hypothetical protein
MNNMLDGLDLHATQEIAERARIPGFYCLVGPEELFLPTVEELRNHFAQAGITNLAIANLATTTVDDIEQLATGAQFYACLYGKAAPLVLEQIELRRDTFLNRGRVLIFLLTPVDWRRLKKRTPAIFSHLKRKNAIGAQRTLDAMGDPFQERLLDVLDKIDEYENHLTDVISSDPKTDPDSLIVLRRWNSFSPIVSWRPISSIESAERDIWSRIRRDIRGGGYLLRWQGFGVAVDPGHNFIENLYEADYTITDLDAVVISHSHLDHTADFEAILDLLYQCNNRGHPHNLSVFLNPTTHRKYEPMLRPNPHVKVIPIRTNKPAFRWISKSPGIKLSAIYAQHTEQGGFTKGMSLKFDLFSHSSKSGRQKTSLGFTADTGWHVDLAPFFQGMDVLVAHLGSVKRYELDEAKRYESHLGILGLFSLIDEVKRGGSNPVIVLSEFGEELIGLRDMLAHELKAKFPDMRIFPGDIGHRIELAPGNLQIACETCGRPACAYFEQEGRIRLCCDEHKPTLGKLE